MKKALIVFLAFVATTAFAQTGKLPVGDDFLKRIENNYKRGGEFNFESKTDAIEKLFFSDFNANVEFFENPSFGGAHGFRVMWYPFDELSRIEIKYVSNYKEVDSIINRKYPLKRPPSTRQQSREERSKMDAYNTSIIRKRRDKSIEIYDIEARFIHISNQLAAKIHQRFAMIIDDFKGTGLPPFTVDGRLVVLRCTVGYDLHTLIIHSPRGDEMRSFVDICNQLIADINSGNFDEAKYLELFE